MRKRSKYSPLNPSCLREEEDANRSGEMERAGNKLMALVEYTYSQVASGETAEQRQTPGDGYSM